jgi:peptide/nickel transport system permease protein
VTSPAAAPALAEPSPSARRTFGARYVLGKVGGAIVSLFVIVVLGFFLIRVLPGDPIRLLTRNTALGPAQVAQLRHDLGLDKSLPAQFVDYLVNLLHGDLGMSANFQQPVSQLIMQRLGPTVLLVGAATVLSVLLGLWQGTRAGWRRGSRFDRLSTGIALTLWSAPTFWLGMIILALAGSWFPTQGILDPDTPPSFLPQALDVLHHLVLPCLTLVAVLYAQNLLVMRSSLLEEMNADYLTTARAKGLRDDLVRDRHAVPNALLPTVTLIFIQLGFVVGGAVTVETVYSWPGLGLLLYQALSDHDGNLLQGLLLVLAGAVLVMNLIGDLLLHVIDPRVRAA